MIAPGVWSPWGSWEWDKTTPRIEETSVLPEKWAEGLRSSISENREPIPDEITPGNRHHALVRLAGAMRRQGAGYETIRVALADLNERRCNPPKSDSEVDSIARYAEDNWPAEPDPNWRILLPGQSQEDDTGTFIDWQAFWSKDRTDPEWLFDDYEMTEDDLYERLEDMGYGPTTNLDRLRYALLPTLPPLDTKDGAAAVGEMLDAVRVDYPEHHVLVVIDTTGRAVEGEENSADTFRRFYSATGIALKRRGVTWCRLDHTGKDISKGQRGSKGKDDDPDIVWFLRESENGIMLQQRKRRMGWVPDRVTFAQSADPLRSPQSRATGQRAPKRPPPSSTGSPIPPDASTRSAQTALKDAGEGRRRELVVAAQKWRNHPGNHSQIRLPEPPAEPPDENPMNTRAEPPPEPAGTTPSGIPGSGSPPL